MKIGPETQLQIQLCEWLTLIKIPFYHFPLEGKRGLLNGHILNKMGMKSGVSDLFFPRKNQDFSGLWMELKIKPNKPTKNQVSFLNHMLEEGYDCVVCYNLDEAMFIIRKFYNLK